jgi:hypothetical protein
MSEIVALDQCMGGKSVITGKVVPARSATLAKAAKSPKPAGTD